MIALLRAYLSAVRASAAGGKEVTVARLVTLSSRAAPARLHLAGDRVLIAAIPDELDALINGRALDLPPPAATVELVAAAEAAKVGPDEALDQVMRWQEDVRDWLLRGTIAPVGDLGWITVEDEVETELDALTQRRRVVTQRQRLRFHAAPQLRAAVADVAPPPPIDLERLTAILRAHASAPVDVTGDLAALDTTLARLGFAAEVEPAVGAHPAIALLQRRCGTKRLAHLRVLGAFEPIPGAMAFAHDGDVIAACTRGDPDPGVFEQTTPDPHRCPDAHPMRLSQWISAALLAAELEALAPASFPDDAIAAIAAELEPYGRIAGALAPFVVGSPAWWSKPPSPPPVPRGGPNPEPEPPHDKWMTMTITGDALQIAPGFAGDILAHESRRAGAAYALVEVPLVRVYEIYPVPGEQGTAWLRIWGCFHDLARGEQDGTTIDLGPMPAAVVGAASSQVRRALGLPRPIDPLLSTRALIGRALRQWIEVKGTWTPGPLDAPDFDGLRLRLPPRCRLPEHGARLRVRGLFDGPSTLYALQWEPVVPR